MLHAHHRPGDAPALGFGGHLRVGHEAVDGPAQLFQHRLVDAAAGHLRVRDDVAAGFQGFDALAHRMLRKDEIVRVIEIRGGVDHPLDDQFVLAVQLPISQQLRDDLKAALLDVHRFDDLRHGRASPPGKSHKSFPQRKDWQENGNGGSPHRAARWPGRRPSAGPKAWRR